MSASFPASDRALKMPSRISGEDSCPTSIYVRAAYKLGINLSLMARATHRSAGGAETSSAICTASSSVFRTSCPNGQRSSASLITIFLCF